ncbi:MAG: metallophosphoesterase [Planctomycetia bacterium]|nr:metallophosphoesterase [Planctomycetia bacterium]
MNRKFDLLDRRKFLQGTICSSALALTGMESAARSNQIASDATPSAEKDSLGTKSFNAFELDENRVRFYSDKIKKKTNILILSDTHLFMDDKRGESYRSFSARMAKAYNKTSHYRTRKQTNPCESFAGTLDYAAKSKTFDAIVVLGDLVSFPSEAGIDWACKKLNSCGVPWYYISGNHDWHYEGMPGSEKELRTEWTQKRLSPLYQGHDPMAYSVDLPGVRLILIDDSIYEILPEQLDFFKRQVREGVPMILMMHIPLYAPGRSVGFGCGHPDWNADHDLNWKIERRPQWPKNGHSDITMEFYRTVFTASNLAGIFTGHTHKQTLDVVNGKPQFAVTANAQGGFMTAEFLPR